MLGIVCSMYVFCNFKPVVVGWFLAVAVRIILRAIYSIITRDPLPIPQMLIFESRSPLKRRMH